MRNRAARGVEGRQHRRGAQLLKTLRWWDGFVIALCNPGFLLGCLGYTLGIFGAVGSLILWGASAAIGMLQAWIYSEPATMFGHRSGGISLYAHEGWRATRRWSARCRRSATGSAGRSCCRSSARSSATSRPRSGGPTRTWTLSIGSNHARPVRLHRDRLHRRSCGLFNIFGVRPAVWFTYACAALLMIPLALFIIVPYITGDWHSLQRARDASPARGAASSWRSCTCSSSPGRPTGPRSARRSRPSTRHQRDTTVALRSAAMFMLLLCVLLPLGLGGVTGVPASRQPAAEGQFYTSAMTQIVGHGAAASSRSASSPACCSR